MFYRLSIYALAALVLGAQAAASLDLGQLGENLKAELEKNPDFRALTPAGHRLGRIELESDISPGPLVWGESAEPLGLIPVGKGSTPFVNCAYDSTRIGRKLIEASHTDTYSFSTTDSSSLAVEVGVEANWPMVSVSGKVTGTVSSSSSESSGQGKTLVLSSQIEGPIPPRHYFEVSVVAYERRIANQPFHVDVEITGNARLHYVPTTSWRAVGSAPRSTYVLAGDEPVPGRNTRRDLYICGVGEHPGKVVAGKCNWTYAGDEREARSYTMLSAPDGSYEWMSRRAFEEEWSDDEVAKGESPAIVSGQENRDDRYNGRLLVCRAKYKGGIHPGKVVINDCMIGYDGREVQIGDYDVLVRTEGRDRQKLIALRDYLPDGLRSFRIEGVFEGARAMYMTAIASQNRPVDGKFCPEGLPASDDPVVAQGAAPEPVARVARAPARGLAVKAASTMETVPQDAAETAGSDSGEEPSLDGQTVARFDLSQDGAEARVQMVYRVLSVEEPLLFGIDVLALQRKLDAAGWPLRQDGFYGINTRRAVALFQAAHGLEADGVFGPATEAVLERYFSG
ncbi:DM9 repeat-containing protein [uncultured Roseovarius sp.]|uniref:DM9 repeat-containing protein n=1 Tax=uncultured Roseovarius sp. TaxID=293344 RepID=UPI0025926416|nr:DM9 repeat-containing protein [uncultured Roseovarius sp.]